MAAGGMPELESWETVGSRSVTVVTDGAGQSRGSRRPGETAVVILLVY